MSLRYAVLIRRRRVLEGSTVTGEREQAPDLGRRRAVVALAGPIAKQRSGAPVDAALMARGSDDLKEARHHASGSEDPQGWLRERNDEAAALVDSDWRAIQSVASELDQRRRLDGKQVRRVVLNC
jgi:hypothetical protein